MSGGQGRSKESTWRSSLGPGASGLPDLRLIPEDSEASDAQVLHIPVPLC